MYLNDVEVTEIKDLDGLETIPDVAFYGLTNLTSVTIPDSVTSIGDYAFFGCTGLKEVTIGKSVESIGDYAFYGTGLTSITIPNSVTSIGEDAFSRCSNLKSISVDEGNATYQSKDGVVYKKDDKSLYLVPWGIEGAVTILDGCTSIDTSAFSGCTGLSEITIPNSVQSIGSNAFRGCTGLQTVNWNATNCTITGNMNFPIFNGCTQLATVNIGEDVQTIPNAFGGCTGITKVNYLGDLKGWCKIEFNGWSANPLYVASDKAKLYVNNVEVVGTVEIPEGTTSIGAYAFYGLTGITSVTIPDSVTSIDSNAFGGCTNITTATMPSNAISFIPQNSLITVTIISGNIGDYAFYRCESLQTVTIGEGVTSIGERAFYRCTGLETVYYEGTSEQGDDMSIGSDNEEFTRAERYYFSEQDPYANHTAKEGEQYWHWDEETHTPEVWVKQD